MAPVVLSAAEETAAMELGSSELKFLLAKEGVDDKTQAVLFHIGITSVGLFATLVKDQDELKDVLRDDLGLDSSASLQIRVKVAKICLAYQKATQRTKEEAHVEGEAMARQLDKPLLNNEYQAMRTAWEAKWWKLDEADQPARTFLERRIADLERGELRAEALTAVLNREQEDDEFMTPVFDASGSLKIKKTSGSIPEPATPEQLRRRIQLSFTALMYMALRHTNRSEIQNITPQVGHSYLQYLLGEHVWELVAKDGNGMTVSAPSWSHVLSYDMAIRKKAYNLMAEGAGTFVFCLKRAWEDATIKERNFTTPLALAAASGKTQLNITNWSAERTGKISTESGPYIGKKSNKGGKGGKGSGKGGKSGKTGWGKGAGGSYKGGGKGQGKGGKSNSWGVCASHTPEGLPICYNYNDANIRCSKQGACWFQHVCGRCFSKHPMYQCLGNKSKPPAQSETQGEMGKGS